MHFNVNDMGLMTNGRVRIFDLRGIVTYSSRVQTLRKHAYLNILKKFTTKKMKIFR